MGKVVRLRDIDRLKWFGLILLISIIAFELYNFDSTRYSLSTFFGDLDFWGIPWAVILAIAFCGVDFAGVAQLFTPQRGREEPRAVWFLFGVWLLASVVNAILTWWAVLIAMITTGVEANELYTAEQMLSVIPWVVAAMVWLARILLIGVAAFGGDHLLARKPATVSYRKPRNNTRSKSRSNSKRTSNTQSRRELRQQQSRDQQQGVILSLDDHR